MNPCRTLAEVVTDRRLVSAEAFARATLVQAETGERLDSVLTRLGMVSEQALAHALSEVSRYPLIGADAFPADAVDLGVSARFLRDGRIVPLRRTAEALEVAVVDPFDSFGIEALAFAVEGPVAARVARAGDVEAALDRLYGAAIATEHAEDAADEADLDRLKDLASDAPVVRAVNGLIARAAEQRASDIHLEPTEDGLKVRFRVDGELREQESLPAGARAAIVSRIKVLADLNIAERRLPQDGRMRLAVRGHEIDLRVATSPTIHGEAAVLRLLDRSHLTLDFVTLGFDEVVLPALRKVLAEPHGVLLVTGPTGSGKTTTLYAALAELNRPNRKILTVEDPIEYRLAGINQTQVAPGIGLDFAAALRSFLRQDPDVVMVGEIRDLETAQVAVQAALTGHMLLSTLHTNTAAAAVTRLLDMGVEPFLITSTLNGVLGQRLVRRLCPACREPHVASERELLSVGLPVEDGEALTLWRPTGCSACGGSGYRGRAAIVELLTVDGEIARLVLARAEAREIEHAAVAAGMRTMLGDGLAKARAGVTTIEEVLRVTREA